MLSAAFVVALLAIDDFESSAAWTAAPSDGVTLSISRDAGRTGQAMRLDFDFHGGAGYAIARKNVALTLPDDFEFSFYIRGEAPPNTLEFKLIDETGENVWWLNQRNITFPREWTRMRIKKRHIQFAWGPGGPNKPLRNVSAIEIVITASTGGKGTVWIDELQLDERAPSIATGPPVITRDPQTVVIDLGARREFGGLTLDWGPRYASSYIVEFSDDGRQWEKRYEVANGNGGRDRIYLPDSDTRFIRLRMSTPYELRDVKIEPLSFSSSRNEFFRQIAQSARPGLYPKYFSNVQSYWTVVGIPGSEREALINEEGAIEVDRSSFSIEPFIYQGVRLLTWRDFAITQRLDDDALPIPTSSWRAHGLRLDVTAIAVPGRDTLYARYELTNTSTERQKVTLFLAMRPFQVNPPWQFLNVPGGTAEVREIRYDDGVIRLDDKLVVAVARPDGFGATTFDSGDISEYLVERRLPAAQRVSDSFGAASAAFRYDVDLAPGAKKSVLLALPDSSGGQAPSPVPTVHEARDAWTRLLSTFELQLPDAQAANTIKSNLAYILLNQDGAAIQPGSRSYDRSWIRDGSLTATALLRLGHTDEARAFVEWFAKYQFPNGKVPCCVDSRGADPVPEHDSHGELIFAVAEVYRHTGDRDFVRRIWPHVRSAVTYIESLIAQRSTDEYRAPEKRAFFGLVPESISHEGYSAKPMHSYWDDFFTLRGLKDAVLIAGILGEDRTRYEQLRDDFRRNLLASIDETMRMHNINYIPGSVELGDFDATSTTIALAPGGELQNLPRAALDSTFERYYQDFIRRRDVDRTWEGYTPYETRAIGTFVRLGQRDRAHELLRFFMRDLRPQQWNQWAEVVYRVPSTPKFIGDMPHTWVGSDFIRSILDMFAYESDDDQQLIIAAGIPASWLAGEGVRMHGMRTHFGTIDIEARGANRVTFDFSGTAAPPRGVILRPPNVAAITRVVADGRDVAVRNGEIELEKLPRRVVVTY